MTLVSRKQPLLLGGLYLLLGCGAITMIYPFLVMLAGSTKSGADAGEQRVIPSFLSDDAALYRKHIEGLFDENPVALQTVYGAGVSSFERLTPPGEPNRELARAWEQFIRQADLDYAVGYLDAPVSRTVPWSLHRFQAHLVKKFGNDLDRVNAALETSFADWSSFQVRQKGSESPLVREVQTFKTTLPLAFRWYGPAAEAPFAAWLQQTLGRVPEGWTMRRAQRDFHYFAFLDMRRELRREFATRNYRTVIGYVLVHGRGLVNTLTYSALAVLAALIVNPAAAYALSRWKAPVSSKLLLWLIATMAFPPLLTQIPTFLLLRKLDLLNTFAALVLPGLANGYSIFLLKGFFDTLPRDLYESASLDGASEWQMFRHIALSLSKPILAVTALGAFVAAYTNFMFAMLICQDQQMWTVMVWLYQLQQRSGPGVVYASLILAAIPTLVIFVAAQKVILRGIVIPSDT